MKRISLSFAFALALQSLCYAGVTKLSAEDRRVLQDLSRFHELHATIDLPPSIVAVCAGDNNKLAEPGQNWNATDSITNPTLPSTRLIWAAAGGDYYVLHYQHGGIAHTYRILVARLANSDAKPKVVWRAIGGPFNNYAAFLEGLQSGKLDDRLANSKFW